ncbi:2-oxoisovalerate dehydrogenase subunit alpha, mitochondrial [Athalia rosae]|uniref:2-oxoisovalerate dehydrogenase subunit alpha, mitochondrial n=1 Tax=Athalia rosae TaxID=37344 RepID=UPI0020341AFC|nr:2-oxoisovalerate dehydrogenase subunit alpha, mitochondrial [Athalia rosae]XP_020706711.2 2-oxoisovalerate dehydrogenase subunit alpha, mitochondrial [Athalia rosae]
MSLKVMWTKKFIAQVSAKCLTRQRNFSTASTIGNSNPEFPIAANIYTDDLKFTNAASYNPIPIYRVLGSAAAENEVIANVKLEKDKYTKMYKDMVTITIMDKILYESQRQGRISFYMTNSGEETVQIGSAAAFNLDDVIYAQYREAGVLLWRGFKLEQFMDQCYGNHADIGKGRQMPVHYGSKDLNFVTISSPLTTQLPQAVGAAYALKRARSGRCVAVYFGEGAASEGDAHAALNFAATLDCPVVFICRNNGYAISTPASQQYKGDGIAAKGPAYGINTIRVDGHDIFAMYNATRAARDWSLAEGKPVLIEAMAYRVGHHSTSDDSSVYRSASEITEWKKLEPIAKFRDILTKIGLWSEAQENEHTTSIKEQILTTFAKSEKKLKPHWKELFTDVYRDMPQHIKNQMDAMEKHLVEYGDKYPLELYKSS